RRSHERPRPHAWHGAHRCGIRARHGGRAGHRRQPVAARAARPLCLCGGPLPAEPRDGRVPGPGDAARRRTPRGRVPPSPRALVPAGTIVLAIGFGWVPFARATGQLLTALGLVIAGQGLASPSLASLISKTVGAAEHGDVLGISQSCSAAARVLGPAGGTLILGRTGASGAYLGAAACAVGALGFTVLGVPAARERGGDPIRLRQIGRA